MEIIKRGGTESGKLVNIFVTAAKKNSNSAGVAHVVL